MDRIIHKITECFIVNQIIPEKQREIYEYCVGVVLETGLFVVTTIIIGMILHQALPAILFLAYFIACLSYTGGLHADKYWQCYIFSMITYLITLVVEVTGNYFNVNPLIANAVFVFCSVTQIVLSPVDSINKQIIEKSDIIRAKIAVMIIFAVFETQYWILWYCKLPGARTIIVSAVLVMVSQIAGKIVNHNCRNSGRYH